MRDFKKQIIAVAFIECMVLPSRAVSSSPLDMGRPSGRFSQVRGVADTVITSDNHVVESLSPAGTVPTIADALISYYWIQEGKRARRGSTQFYSLTR